MNLRLQAALAAALAAAAAGVSATEFSVTPVRIFMTPRDRAVAITVVNESDEEMVMQSELFSWSQKPDGQDELAPTDDLVLSPPIVKLAPKSRQVVRLARVGPPPAGGEQHYRMLVREVPEARPAGKELKVQLALAFSLPVFITPPGAKSQLNCAVERVQADLVKATCENSGNAYAQARGFSLLAADGATLAARDSGAYLLPNVKRSFDIKAAGRIPGGRVKLNVALDNGTTQTFESALAD